MLNVGQDARVSLTDLRTAVSGLPMPRRKPVRYRSKR
jgi:hypothetical protein